MVDHVPDSELNALGERLRTARQARKMTQAALAEAAGVSHAYPFHLEVGKVKDPSHRILASLARVLDVPIEWLAEGTGPEPLLSSADAGSAA